MQPQLSRTWVLEDLKLSADFCGNQHACGEFTYDWVYIYIQKIKNNKP